MLEISALEALENMKRDAGYNTRQKEKLLDFLIQNKHKHNNVQEISAYLVRQLFIVPVPGHGDFVSVPVCPGKVFARLYPSVVLYDMDLHSTPSP